MRYLLQVLLAVLLGTAACGGGGGGPVSPNGSMSAKIDGASWNAIAVQAVYGSNHILSFAGSDVANPSRAIGGATLANGPGTYPITSLNPTGANASLTIGPAVWMATGAGSGTGTITINTLTATTASGTFSFHGVAAQGTSATGTKEITEGAFNVKF